MCHRRFSADETKKTPRKLLLIYLELHCPLKESQCQWFHLSIANLRYVSDDTEPCVYMPTIYTWVTQHWRAFWNVTVAVVMDALQVPLIGDQTFFMSGIFRAVNKQKTVFMIIRLSKIKLLFLWEFSALAVLDQTLEIDL